MKKTRFNYYRKFVNNMTIKDVAEAIGCSESLVTRYDRGLKNIKNASYTQLEKFANLFGCQIEDLFDK